MTESAVSMPRALAVPGLFTADRHALGVDAVRAAPGCSVPTGHRDVRALVAAGLLRPPPGALYGLGPRIVLQDAIMRRSRMKARRGRAGRDKGAVRPAEP